MNSRSGVNETNLVNFSADLSILNQLDTKDGLLSIPFDHIYACHSEGSERRQTLQLDKEVEISTHCVVSEQKDLVVGSNPEVTQLAERLTVVEKQNRKLKDLLVYHLDLIQQQNEILTKKDKLYQALKQENDSLKSKLSRMDRRVAVSQRHSVNPPPLVHVPTPTVTSTIVKNEPSSASQIMLNSFTELLLPENRTNSCIYESDLDKKQKGYGQEPFEITQSSEPVSDVASYLSGDLGVSSILENNINCENFTMIESKRSLVKKELLKTENRSEPLYTVTTNSGNIQRIQRNRRRSTGLGSLSRMSKSPGIKMEPPESKVFDDPNFTVHKKSKMINTYGKSKQPSSKRTSQFTGSLSDRLQLIDTTPTGEDPYQLGEADMREQSPIPKLMLQKTNHGRMKICTDTSVETTSTSRRVYNSSVSEGNTKASHKVKLDRYNITSTYVHPSEIKSESPNTLMVDEPDLDIVKTEAEIDWRIYNPNKIGNETSLCDFSYGETPNNLTSSVLPPLDSVEFEELFAPESPLHLEPLNSEAFNTPREKNDSDKSRKRAARTTSLIGPDFNGEETSESKRASNNDKRGRKRASSTTGLVKTIKRENLQKGVGQPQKPKLMKAPCRTKVPKSPVPAMVTPKPYFTLVGDPDLSWYLGLDPDVKLEDVDTAGDDTKVSSVEVPRWREKPYTSTYTLEGTENLDDKVFEKRHQKLEAEERRQLRWHMRRIREQRHVERLRQRQRDPWAGGGGGGGGGSPAPALQPAVFTVWPQPQRDLRYIEITDTLPVTAFGELLPALPDSDFVLPWVKTSKAMKRSKRSKTLH